MTSEYSVDLADLETLAARLRAYQGFLTDQLDELTQRVRALTSNWSGQAAAAFDEAHRDWARSVAQLESALQTMEQDAARAHTSYSAVIATNSKMVGRRR
ncbi:WXG100 family type VII secretion target [Nocardia xishanensis]|uniref:WXG100 family type VII secretion target n=1 Tax=Nocardia xishanensis TaxID=238964 RepID=UPI0008349B9D|nr:WXG100 family type VII secretion target [Nocardia xishanensis]